jgi:hypothetical protein
MPRNLPRWAGAFVQQAIACQDEACLIWPYACDSKGRPHVSDCGTVRSVAIVVCEAVNGVRPSPGHHASHLCRNGPCVNGRHLVWETRAENDARERGYNPARKLEAHQVRKIREHFNFLGAEFLAEAHNMKPKTISKIARGKMWSWLE